MVDINNYLIAVWVSCLGKAAHALVQAMQAASPLTGLQVRAG